MEPQPGPRDASRNPPHTASAKTFLVRGNNRVAVHVKPVLAHRVYIAREESGELYDGKEPFRIRKGAVLVRNEEQGRGGEPLFMIFNDGVHDAIMAQGHHVGETSDAEFEELQVILGAAMWALGQSFVLHKDSPAADIQAFLAANRQIWARLEKSRNQQKLEAAQAALRASQPATDGQTLNVSARTLVEWMIIDRIDDRVKAFPTIRDRIDARKWALVRVRDECASLIARQHMAVRQMLRWADPHNRGRFTVGKAKARALELRNTVRVFEQISLAPHSRRGLPHCAHEIDAACDALTAFDVDRAFALLDRADRALTMRAAREILEIARARLARQRDLPDVLVSPQGAVACMAIVDRVQNMLVIDGQPIDHDFENPVIAQAVLPPFNELRRITSDAHAFQAADAYEALKQSAKPL